jgi:hypothetical protein
MTDALLGGLFMAGGVAAWWLIVRRSGDMLHPLGLMLLFWFLVFGFAHWDVPATYDEPYYAQPFELRTYAVVLASIAVFALGYWLIDPDLPRLEPEGLASRLRGSVRVTATTVYFIRLAGEIPLFSPQVDELRQIWKRPLIGYVYDLHYVVALFGTILVDRARTARERAFWAGLALASVVQLAFGAVRISPLTGIVWASVYIFYRRAGRVRLRQLALLALVVFGVSSLIEYYRRTPLRLNPDIANPRLDLGLAATVWGHTGASFKNLQLSLDKHVPFLSLGATSYDVAKTLNPGLRERDEEISYRYGVHNTTTYLIPLYMDFGWFGLLVMPGVYGALTALVYRQFRDRTGILWLIVYIDFLVAVVLAFRTHRFLGNSLIFFGAVGLLTQLVAGTDREPKPTPEEDWSQGPLPEGLPAA